jgi:hypothetical protein
MSTSNGIPPTNSSTIFTQSTSNNFTIADQKFQHDMLLSYTAAALALAKHQPNHGKGRVKQKIQGNFDDHSIKFSFIFQRKNQN